MKKVISAFISVTFVLTILTSLALLTGCGSAQPLPEGMTEDAVTRAAKNTVNALNEKDYDTIIESMDSAMKKTLTADALAAAWEPFFDDAGDFEEIESTTVTANGDFGVAVVSAEYDDKDVVFTLSYDEDMKLAGLYFK